MEARVVIRKLMRSNCTYMRHKFAYTYPKRQGEQSRVHMRYNISNTAVRGASKYLKGEQTSTHAYI
jgi:hypothetical protein